MNNHPVNLSKTELVAGFMMKVVLGLTYGWIFLHLYHGDDTWEMHGDSLKQTSLLLNNPGRFFSGYLPLHVFDANNGMHHRVTQFFAEMEFALVIKTLATFNLVSRGNYYINSVLFNALIFCGHYWLFNVLNRQFPEKRKALYLAIFFFVPVVFWLSGIRGDGMLFFFFAMTMANLFKGKRGLSPVYALIGFTGVLIIRPEFGLLLFIAVVAYLVTLKFRRHPFLTFVIIYGAVALLFLVSLLTGFTGIADHIILRQHLFLLLKGTTFPLDALEPHAGSFIKVLPQAINNSFFRPYLWEVHSVLQVFYAIEVIVLLLLSLLAVFIKHANWKERLSNPVILMLLFFSLSVYLFIGYVVPFPGAIIRYKCIAELGLICVMVVVTDYKVIFKYKYI
ncbi:MAG: hypothetical protein ABI415_09815 [Flavitalea sp.]